MNIADPSLNINAQANAILAILADTEPTFAEYDQETRHYNVKLQTFPWYNGGERGYSISVTRPMGRTKFENQKRTLIVVFAEEYNSDSIFVMHWTLSAMPHKPPDVDEADKGTTNRKNFSYLQINQTIKHIVRLMTEHMKGIK